MKIFDQRKKQFILAGIKERLLFQWFQKHFSGIEILSISKVEESQQWDVIFTSASTKYLCEVKTRYIKQSDYTTTLLNSSKIESLKQSATTYMQEESGFLSPCLLIFFKDDKVAFFPNLFELNKDYVESRMGRYCTVADSPIVKKDETHIPFEHNSIVYDLDLSKDWKAISVEVANFMFPNNQFD